MDPNKGPMLDLKCIYLCLPFVVIDLPVKAHGFYYSLCIYFDIFHIDSINLTPSTNSQFYGDHSYNYVSWIVFFSSSLEHNECVTNQHNCDENALCFNTVGGHNCVCQPGYTGNGTICKGNILKITYN